jgi:hypothetical protein
VFVKKHNATTYFLVSKYAAIPATNTTPTIRIGTIGVVGGGVAEQDGHIIDTSPTP